MLKSSAPAMIAAFILAGCVVINNGNDRASADECRAIDFQSLVGTNIAAITLPTDLDHRLSLIHISEPTRPY